MLENVRVQINSTGSNSRGGGFSLEFLVGLCRPNLQMQTQFQTKKMPFSTPVFRPGLKNPYPFSDLTFNLGQIKWNIWTTPPPHFNDDAKMARFCSFAPSSLLWGGRGLIVPFYSVQDCWFSDVALESRYIINKSITSCNK